MFTLFPSSLLVNFELCHLTCDVRAMTSDHAIDFTTDENFCGRLVGIPDVWHA